MTGSGTPWSGRALSGSSTAEHRGHRDFSTFQTDFTTAQISQSNGESIRHSHRAQVSSLTAVTAPPPTLPLPVLPLRLRCRPHSAAPLRARALAPRPLRPPSALSLPASGHLRAAGATCRARAALPALQRPGASTALSLGGCGAAGAGAGCKDVRKGARAQVAAGALHTGVCVRAGSSAGQVQRRISTRRRQASRRRSSRCRAPQPRSRAPPRRPRVLALRKGQAAVHPHPKVLRAKQEPPGSAGRGLVAALHLARSCPAPRPA
jgi:hypothetical protein